MRLTVFNAGDGDCLLLSSADGRHMLIDGGRAGTFVEHAAAPVSACGELDIVCVSHIDADHITGLLTLLEHEVDWRVHLLEAEEPPEGRAPFPQPRVPRPPRIAEVWHNGFGDQLGEDADDVRGMLSLAAASQTALETADLIPRQHYLADLALGEKQAIELSHRIGTEQLDIPLNAHFGGQLILAGDPRALRPLGSATLTVIGPFAEDVDKLREEWRDWLRDNARTVEALREEMSRDAERLQLSEGELFLEAMCRIGALSTEFGDRDTVSTPNLASIMLLAEEGGRSVLLTGDAAGQDILKGLRAAGKLDADGRIHVDVLKVQHHGAGANIDAEFARAVIADDYVFCGNGSHHNPEVGVVELIARSRIGPGEALSGHAAAGAPFRLHFNNTPETAGTASRARHMRRVAAAVATLEAESEGRMTGHFHADGAFAIELEPCAPPEQRPA